MKRDTQPQFDSSINHAPEALAQYQERATFCDSRDVDVQSLFDGRNTELVFVSPPCAHFHKVKGRAA